MYWEKLAHCIVSTNIAGAFPLSWRRQVVCGEDSCLCRDGRGYMSPNLAHYTVSTNMAGRFPLACGHRRRGTARGNVAKVLIDRLLRPGTQKSLRRDQMVTFINRRRSNMSQSAQQFSVCTAAVRACALDRRCGRLIYRCRARRADHAPRPLPLQLINRQEAPDISAQRRHGEAT